MIKLPKQYLKSKNLLDQQLQQQEADKPKIQLRDFNPVSNTLDEIDNLDLHDIEAIKLSDSGARGVIFIETKRGTIVLKLSGEVGVDYFLNRLAHEYQIPTPKMRFLRWQDEEMIRVKEQIIDASKCDEVLIYRIKSKLKVAFFEVIEYIPSLHCFYFKGDRAEMVYSNERLETIGKIYAFDIFINNGDRYPLKIWRSVGNYDNILLKIADVQDPNLTDLKNVNFKMEQFYAIDPTIILRGYQQETQNKILEEYISKVSSFLEEAMQDYQNETCNSFRLFVAFVEKITNYTIPAQKIKYVIKGLFKEIELIVSKGFIRFDTILSQSFLEPELDWSNTFNQNLDRIDRVFHLRVMEVYKDFINKYQEIFNSL